MQKARKVTKTKAQEEAKKIKYTEEEKKKKQLKYLKKLWDEVLAEDTILMAGTKNSQVIGTKYKKIVNIFSENKARLWPSRKTKGKQLRKYHGNVTVKIGVITPMRGVYMPSKTA